VTGDEDAADFLEFRGANGGAQTLEFGF